MINMNFNYQKICDNLLTDLPKRTSDIIGKRFGLDGKEKQTLEEIGQSYGITRERVRQIVEEGLLRIYPKIKEYQKVFRYFNDVLKSFGDLKKEDVLLSFLGGKKLQNQVSFLLALDKNYKKISEDEDFYSLWTRKKETVPLAKKVVAFIFNKFQTEKKPVSLEEIYEAQKTEVKKILEREINKNIFNSYLEISKKIQKNPEQKLGLRDWIEINPRGIKDKAFLVFKKEGRPLHFSEVANFIEKLPFAFQRKVHLATVHNELIKDPRFVLVGRGIYALKEWGYEPGVVKEIIYKILKEAKKPLTKGEILEKVLNQRIVKENTILLNLQDRNYFLRDSDGRYQIKSVKEA